MHYPSSGPQVQHYQPQYTTQYQEHGQENYTTQAQPTSSHHSLILGQRDRVTYTRYQVELLNALYEKLKYPNTAQKQLIAKRVGIHKDQVKIWFQNRRRKAASKTGYNPPPVETQFIEESLVDALLEELLEHESEKETNKAIKMAERLRVQGQKRKCPSSSDESDQTITTNTSHSHMITANTLQPQLPHQQQTSMIMGPQVASPHLNNFHGTPQMGQFNMMPQQMGNYITYGQNEYYPPQSHSMGYNNPSSKKRAVMNQENLPSDYSGQVPNNQNYNIMQPHQKQQTGQGHLYPGSRQPETSDHHDNSTTSGYSSGSSDPGSPAEVLDFLDNQLGVVGNFFPPNQVTPNTSQSGRMHDTRQTFTNLNTVLQSQPGFNAWQNGLPYMGLNQPYPIGMHFNQVQNVQATQHLPVNEYLQSDKDQAKDIPQHQYGSAMHHTSSTPIPVPAPSSVQFPPNVSQAQEGTQSPSITACTTKQPAPDSNTYSLLTTPATTAPPVLTYGDSPPSNEPPAKLCVPVPRRLSQDLTTTSTISTPCPTVTISYGKPGGKNSSAFSRVSKSKDISTNASNSNNSTNASNPNSTTDTLTMQQLTSGTEPGDYYAYLRSLAMMNSVVPPNVTLPFHAHMASMQDLLMYKLQGAFSTVKSTEGAMPDLPVNLSVNTDSNNLHHAVLPPIHVDSPVGISPLYQSPVGLPYSPWVQENGLS